MTSISTSNMVVSKFDSSSSITAFWIIFLTVVCTVVILGAIGVSVWKVRTMPQHKTADPTFIVLPHSPGSGMLASQHNLEIATEQL